MPDITYTDNDDGTHTFVVIGEAADLTAIESHPDYNEGKMALFQSVYIGGKHTVVFKDRATYHEAYEVEEGVSELQDYARKHFGEHVVAAGNSRILTALTLGIEHPDIFKAKLEGAGINLD